MTTIQRSAISSPAEGLLIFNTTTKCFESYVGGAWNIVSCPTPCNTAAGGTISGDASVCQGESYVPYKVAITNGMVTYGVIQEREQQYMARQIL